MSSTITRGRKFHIDGGTYSKFAFQIVCDQRDYSFSASTASVVMSWVTALNRAISVNCGSLQRYSKLAGPSKSLTGSLGKQILKKRKSIGSLFESKETGDANKAAQLSRQSVMQHGSILPPIATRCRSSSIGTDRVTFHAHVPLTMLSSSESVPEEFVTAAIQSVRLSSIAINYD